MKRVNNLLSDSSSFRQLIVIHSEHKMDVIKIERNLLVKMTCHHHITKDSSSIQILPLAFSVFRAENQVSISGQTPCFVLLCLNTEGVNLMFIGLCIILVVE